MGDTAILWLYIVKFVVYVIFGVACFYRVHLNNLAHRRIRWALIVLGSFLASESVVTGIRIFGRHIEDALERGTFMASWVFGLSELVTTVLLILLFFVLQKPTPHD